MKKSIVIISIIAVLTVAGYCLLNWYVREVFSLALPGKQQT